jgi:aspartyl-tRNA(Asn)/glutamyl-tRNA(Gln) amidotransferase subunit C
MDRFARAAGRSTSDHRTSTGARQTGAAANLECPRDIWHTGRHRVEPGRPARERFPPAEDAPTMALTRNEVAKVALLARLRLDPDELETFTSQLSSIVDFVAQLQEPDTAGVEPLAHGVEVRNAFRDDVRGPSLPREAALANAPDRNHEAFLVPAVLE